MIELVRYLSSKPSNNILSSIGIFGTKYFYMRIESEDFVTQMQPSKFLAQRLSSLQHLKIIREISQKYTHREGVDLYT